MRPPSFRAQTELPSSCRQVASSACRMPWRQQTLRTGKPQQQRGYTHPPLQPHWGEIGCTTQAPRGMGCLWMMSCSSSRGGIRAPPGEDGMGPWDCCLLPRHRSPWPPRVPQRRRLCRPGSMGQPPQVLLPSLLLQRLGFPSVHPLQPVQRRSSG